MKKLHYGLFLAAAATLAIAGCKPTATAGEPTKEPATGSDDLIKSAMTAAPAAVAAGAAIVTAGPDGTMKTLREGGNGFTCMPDNPATPGPDPMCMDANAMEWAMAWMGKKQPPAETPGLMYMLAGGTDASNTDPYAQKPDAGGDWVKTGAHIMVVGSAAILRGHPAGPGPDTSKPYVMWAGTPYAHLMIPVN